MYKVFYVRQYQKLKSVKDELQRPYKNNLLRLNAKKTVIIAELLTYRHKTIEKRLLYHLFLFKSTLDKYGTNSTLLKNYDSNEADSHFPSYIFFFCPRKSHHLARCENTRNAKKRGPFIRYVHACLEGKRCH